MLNDLARLDCTAQAELVRRRQVAPADLVDAAIARIEQLDPAAQRRHPAALRQGARRSPETRSAATGPFRGVPFLLKDLHRRRRRAIPYHAGMQLL